jgi:omega-amidase
MKTFSISLAQIQIEFGQPVHNLKRADGFISAAARSGSAIILFPELWTTGYDLSKGQRHSASNLEVLSEIRRLSATHQIAVGGSYLLEEEDRVFNTFVLIHPSGQEDRYSKIHLFRLMAEDSFLQPGSSLQTSTFTWGKAGLAICYDLRFPELFRNNTLNGAILHLLAAEWPTRRVTHWQTLLCARAIENQAYVAAVNAVGAIGEETFAGRSAVIDPWGETVVEGSPDQENLLTAQIDLNLVTKVRQAIPALTDRRPDIYE